MAKAVAKAKNTAPAPMDLMGDLTSDIQQGLGQDFETSDLIIPRITILQDLSAQVKEHKAEYVQGARPSMIYNSVNNALETVLSFVPAKYHAPWVAWKPRPDGGLVSNNVDPSILTEENGFHEDGIDRFVGHMRPSAGEDPVKVEVIKTPEWIGVARGENGWIMPVAISFAATKSKMARKINTAIDLCELETAPQVFQKAPPFWHTFLLSTALEQAGDNEWWGWTVTHDCAPYMGDKVDPETGEVLGTGLICNTDPRMLQKAREIRKSFEAGEATVAEATEQG